MSDNGKPAGGWAWEWILHGIAGRALTPAPRRAVGKSAPPAAAAGSSR